MCPRLPSARRAALTALVLALAPLGAVSGAAAAGAPAADVGALAGAVDVSQSNALLARSLYSGGYAAGIAPEYVEQARNIPTGGGLEVLLFPQGSIRAAGVDDVVIDVAQAREGVTDARRVEVRISGKPYLRVERITAPGWACRLDDGAALCRRGRIATPDGGPNILLRMRGARAMPVGTQPLTARLTWLESNLRGGRSATEDVSRVRVPTAPALGVRVAREGTLRQPASGTAGQDVTMFRGRVIGIAGALVETTWHQLCTTPAEARAQAVCAGVVAPRAVFLAPARDTETEARVAMAVSLPAVSRPTPLHFALTARDEADQVTATATVIATPQRVALLDPRLGLLDDAVAEIGAVQRGDLVGERLPLLASRVVSSAGTGAIRPDRDVTLRVRVPGRRITGVRWSVVAGPQTLLRGARITGGALTLRAPRALAGQTAVVLGRATIAGGDTVDATTLIRIAGTASAPGVRTRDARLLADAAVVRARGAETARAADALLADKLGGRTLARDARAATAQDRLCDYWALAGAGRQQPLPADPAAPGTPDAVLGDGAGFWLGPEAAVSAGPCGETSTIAFAKGEIIFGETRFTNVRGEITRAGLRITGGTYRPPDEWLDLLPGLKETILQGTTFTVPEGLGVTAPFTKSGSWGALGGEFRLATGLEMLELPKGWRFQPARLRLDTTGLILAELSAQAPGGAAEGEGSLSIAYGPLGQLELDASVANLGVLRQSDGSQVSLSGQGTLSITWKDNPDSETEDSGLSLVVDPEISIEAKGPIRLMDNFEIQELALKWNPAKIEAAGKVRVGSKEQENYLDLALKGAYAGADDWSFALDSAGSWKPGAGITVSKLKGEVERSGTMTTVSVAGAAAGWTPTPALTVESLSADVTNRCPADTGPEDCDPAEVRLELDVKGSLRLPIEGSTPTAWTSTARVNLKTLKFTIAGSIADGQIGPKELNLRSIQINISNEQDAGTCMPASPPEKPSDGVRFGLVATGTVLGKDVSFTGQFGGDVGLCLLGEMTSMPRDVPDAGNFSDILVGYASQDVTIPRANAPPMQLKARQLRISAAFRLPESAKAIGVSGTGRFEAAVTSGNGFQATVAFTLESRPVLFGEVSGSHLRMDGVLFEFDWAGPNGTRFVAGAEFSYLTVASAASSTTASETPLKAEIAFTARGATISAGVDSARAPGGEVVNAFGVPDLKIRTLKVDLTLGADPSFGFDADATLPARWSEPIGITSGSVVRLAANISQASPCFDFAIRRPANEPTPTTGKRMAVDLGGKGLLAASELSLTLAPTGCTVGGREIRPGFAVAFDGEIGGTVPVPVKVQAALTLPTPQQPTNFRLVTDVNVGAFSIGGAVAFEETVLKLDIDVPANRYSLELKGGVNVLGNVSRVDAAFRSEGLGNVYLRAKVEARIGLSGLRFDGDLDLELDVKAYKVQTARLNGRLDFKVLGTTLLGANAAFEYTQGRVTMFQIGVEAGINLGIASASGRVDVEYRLLKEPETAKDYTHRLFKVGFGGSFRIFFIRKSFSISIVDSKVPISKAADAVSQDANWQDTDEQAQPVQPADPEIRWPMVIGKDGSTIAFGRITAITYRTAYAVDSAAGAPARGSASGGLEVRVCQSYPVAGARCAAERILNGVVYFQKQEIELTDGSIDFRDPAIVEACKGAASTLACSGRPYVLRGTDWTHAVRLIERARAEYRAVNAGQELPPVKAWSADRIPEALGAFGGPHDRKDRRARWEFSGGVQGAIPRTNGPGERYFGQEYGRATGTYDLVRQAPERALPLAGDWDGDGIDNLAVWYSPLRSGIEGRWDFRRSDGTTFTVRRGSCETEFCGAIEPLGTTQAATMPADVQNGSKGAYWPIAGDWNGSTVDGMTVDDIGRVTLLADGRLRWELWPQGEPTRIFRLMPGFGRQPDGVVDRPVVGDWNADGVTDIGVYRGPAVRGGRGTWFLWLSTTIAKTASGWDVEAPDFTIAFGSHGDLPVVGDWDNSGGDGIGVVAPQASSNIYDTRQWTLRFDADASCGENCRSDLSPHYGYDAQYPIVGRWGP